MNYSLIFFLILLWFFCLIILIGHSFWPQASSQSTKQQLLQFKRQCGARHNWMNSHSDIMTRTCTIRCVKNKLKLGK